MKKMIYLLVVIASFAYSAGVYAQSTSNVLNVTTLGADRTGVRAIREFWRLYGEGKNERWYKLPGGYLAEFEEDNIHHKLVFDKRGSWLYTMREYTEKELPRTVRHLVKSTYYDHTIGWVKEVIQHGTLTYVVHIEDATEWKDLIIRDGEMEVQMSYERQAASCEK